MLTPKQRAHLRSLANPISQRYLLGKEELAPGFLEELDKALEAKELIKVGLLSSCALTPKEVSPKLCDALGCECAGIIGRVIILYRRSRKNPQINP